jgi:hypothetical protein
VGNRKRQDLAALAAAALVLVGGGIARVATYGGDTKVAARVLGQTFTRPAPTTTAPAPTAVPTTAPVQAAAPAAPATTTTTAAPAPTTTTTHPAPAPAPTATTVPAPPDCGTGQARAKATATVLADRPGHYVMAGAVDITNNLSKTIVVDTLVVRVIFADQSSDVVSLPAAIGSEIATDETRTIPFQDQSTTRIPTTAVIDALDYHVAGVAGCDPHHLTAT